MGVLSCNRQGCGNIMCDLVSDRYGYLCGECYNELLSKPFIDIDTFMDSEKDVSESDIDQWEQVVNRVFKDRHKDGSHG